MKKVGFLEASAFRAKSFLRRFLGREGPHPRTLLSRLIVPGETVFFVQVGAADGVYDDPLREHILRWGWSGILIEPVPHMFRRLQENCRGLPGLALEHCAIAPQAGAREFFYLEEKSSAGGVSWPDMLGSFRRDVLLKHNAFDPEIEGRLRTTTVPCETFAAVLERHSVRRVDVLCMDAEGSDGEILRSWDFARFRPAVVLFEHRHLSRPDLDSCLKLLRSQGYGFIQSSYDTLAWLR